MRSANAQYAGSLKASASAAALPADRVVGIKRPASSALEPSTKPRRVDGATGMGEHSLLGIRCAGGGGDGAERSAPTASAVVSVPVDAPPYGGVSSFLGRLKSSAMAGHSKWAGIKHKKAIVGSRRGKLFTKLARAITVAAKEGGGDVVGNAALALAVQKAKDASMPKDNIERAIAKGTGEGADTEAMEAGMYEGYGPGGVAILVEALTDNRNRTGSDVRHLFSKHGGNLGEPGSVAYLFDKRGVIVVDGTRYSEDDLLPAIEAGALDVSIDDDVFEV